MSPTNAYPVLWTLDDGDPIPGALEIAGDDIRLTGRTPDGTRAASRIAAAEIFHVSRSGAAADRVAGLPAVVVDERGGRRFVIAPRAGEDHLSEIAGLLQDAAGLAGKDVTRVVVRVPLDPGHVEDVRALVRRGPPYDLSGVQGVDHHEVYVGGGDAIFLFEGADPGLAVERVMRDARVWSTLERWNPYVTGPPAVVQPDYLWSRRPEPRR